MLLHINLRNGRKKSLVRKNRKTNGNASKKKTWKAGRTAIDISGWNTDYSLGRN